MKIKFILLFICAFLCSYTSVSAKSLTAEHKEYLVWLEDLKEEMIERGISKKTLKKAYAKDYYNPKPDVVKIDRKQVEFALTSVDILIGLSAKHVWRWHKKNIKNYCRC